jgi:hypothetical protein
MDMLYEQMALYDLLVSIGSTEIKKALDLHKGKSRAQFLINVRT